MIFNGLNRKQRLFLYTIFVQFIDAESVLLTKCPPRSFTTELALTEQISLTDTGIIFPHG